MWGAGVEGRAAWAHVKGGGGVKWGREGRDLEVALNYDHPGAALHVLELSVSFSVSEVGTGGKYIKQINRDIPAYTLTTCVYVILGTYAKYIPKYILIT